MRSALVCSLAAALAMAGTSAKAADLVTVSLYPSDVSTCTGTPEEVFIVGDSSQCVPTAPNEYTRVDCEAETYATYNNSGCTGAPMNVVQGCEVVPSTGTVKVSCQRNVPGADYIVLSALYGGCDAPTNVSAMAFLWTNRCLVAPSASSKVTVSGTNVTHESWSSNTTCSGEPSTVASLQVGVCGRVFGYNGIFSFGKDNTNETRAPTSDATVPSAALGATLAVVSALAALVSF